MRVLRLCRIIKMVVQSKKLMVIYRTLADTAPVLGSFGLLLILLLFMFTVVAVQIFALVDVSRGSGLEREMGYHANF